MAFAPANAADLRINAIGDHSAPGANIAVEDPELILAESITADDIPISATSTLEQKIERLELDVRRLNKAARRATIIVTANMQLGETGNLQSVSMEMSGGNLAKPLRCLADQFGQCIFVLNPSVSTKPPYLVRITAPRYEPAEMQFRATPGSIVSIPVRMELNPVELERRIRPPSTN